MRYLGVDLHSNNFTVCFLAEDGTHTFEKYPLKEFDAFKCGLRFDDHVAVEATGNSRFFHSQVAPLVSKCIVVNAGQFGVIKQSVSKTDRNDARALAQFLALIEKQVTTPEYYPLTLNALRQACNQLSNREPVVAFDERTVAWTLESLRDRKLIRAVTTADGRVPKYRHVLDEALGLKSPEMAVMCVLMLRGAQTVGEIRTRTERLYPFSALSFVETTLEDLMTRDAPLVVKLPRQMGQKESRYAHLLGGEVQVAAAAETDGALSPQRVEAATLEVRGERERIARLEDELKTVRAELAELREGFAEFKKQFE